MIDIKHTHTENVWSLFIYIYIYYMPTFALLTTQMQVKIDYTLSYIEYLGYSTVNIKYAKMHFYNKCYVTSYYFSGFSKKSP